MTSTETSDRRAGAGAPHRRLLVAYAEYAVSSAASRRIPPSPPVGFTGPFVALAIALCLVAFGSTARAEEGDGKDEKTATSALLDRVSRHCVALRVRFQKDLEAEARGAVAPDPRSMNERLRSWRMSYLVPGFLVRDRRTVVASDLWVPPGAVASITIETLSGGKVLGRLRGFLRRAQGVVIEAEADVDAEPVPFPERITVTIDTPLVAGSVLEGTDGLEAWVEGLGGVRRRPVSRRGFAYGQPESPTEGLTGTAGDDVRTVDLVMDAKSTPLGFRFGGTMDLGSDLWMGPDVLEDTEVAFTATRALADSLRLSSALHRVKTYFRTASRHDRGASPFGGEDATPEAEFWGLAVAPDALLVIGRLEDGEVRRIEAVRVQDDDGAGTEAAFAGRVKGYDAFVVRVPSGGLAPLPAEAPPVPGLGEAFLVHRVAWRGGARRDQVDYDRVTGWARGYADGRFLAAEQEVDEGSVLMTVDGKVFGFAARLDPEDRERPLGDVRPRSGQPTFQQVAVLFAEVGLPAGLVADPDTQVMPAEETEAKRLPWLGVEYDAISPGVAELMEVSEATLDGQRGLVVTMVHADSPAAKAGVQEGDILLTVRKTSGPGADAPPVDLKDRDDGGFGGFPFSFGDSGSAPWRPAGNALVKLLQSWGAGTTYDLALLRDVKPLTLSFTVEVGPPDFHSAPRMRDEPTGLSVRDLTFEVKAALRMPPAAKGAVVARVEPGSPGAQARIDANELILEYDGRPVEGAKSLEEMLTKDRAAGKQTARLVVRRLGKTRIVDLSLVPQEGAGESPEETGSDEGESDEGDGEEPR